MVGELSDTRYACRKKTLACALSEALAFGMEERGDAAEAT